MIIHAIHKKLNMLLKKRMEIIPEYRFEVILCTAENLTIDCEDFENWFVF